MEMKLLEIREQAEEIAREAGKLLRHYYDKPLTSSLKSSTVDLVTEADQQSEKTIVERLQGTFPDHGIEGEEGSDINPDAPYCWLIDPLDGTTNFSHRLPHFSVSMALAGPDGYPVVGIVYDPMRDECFAAVKKHGATCNGETLAVSMTEKLAQAMVVSGFPYDKWTDSENNVDHWRDFVVRTQGIRRLGSAALDLAYVAAGRFDGYWEHKLHRWDMLAGILLVQEAGGVVTDYEGGQEGVLAKRPRLVAANPNIHAEMVTVIQKGAAAPLPQK